MTASFFPLAVVPNEQPILEESQISDPASHWGRATEEEDGIVVLTFSPSRV